jgi:hypothetical protein
VFQHPAAAHLNSPIWGIVVKYPGRRLSTVAGPRHGRKTPTVQFTRILLVTPKPGRFSGYVFGRRFSPRCRRPDFLQPGYMGPARGPFLLMVSGGNAAKRKGQGEW